MTSTAMKRAAELSRLRHSETDDLRIRAITPMVPPACLMEDVPSSASIQQTVADSRAAVRAILAGEDDRVIVVAGPCTVHDPAATLDYAMKLREVARRHERDVLVVMRLNFRKPSRTRGWQGFIHDPARDGSFAINRGLQAARQLLVRVLEMGLAVGTTFHDMLQPQFFADLVTWLWMSPHTTASQTHIELASGLSMPVAFCDRGGGPDFDSASAESHALLRALQGARMPHAFLSVSKQGVAGIVHTGGNDDCHPIVGGPDALSRARALAGTLGAHNLGSLVLVDCYDASAADACAAQAACASAVARAIGEGEGAVCGVSLKSFLLSGHGRAHAPGGAGDGVAPAPPPVYGLSLTDPCIDWTMTKELIEQLADGARHRRSRRRSAGRARPLPPLAGGAAPYGEHVNSATDNLRIRGIKPLLPPACLILEQPCAPAASELIAAARAEIGAIVRADGRARAGSKLLVVVGPRVVHDTRAALEFAGRLRSLAARHASELCVVLGATFERAHAGAGWKGLVSDPGLDGSCRINSGLREARSLLLAAAGLALPVATDFMDTIMPQYLADLASYTALDARAASHYLMSELASGLSMPVGVRVGADGARAAGDAGGGVCAATRTRDSVGRANGAHVFLSVSKENLAGIVHTQGNADAHAVVVGDANLRAASEALREAGLPSAPVVDCALDGPQPAAAHAGGAAGAGAEQAEPPASTLEAQRQLVARVVEAVKEGGCARAPRASRRRPRPPARRGPHVSRAAPVAGHVGRRACSCPHSCTRARRRWCRTASWRTA